MPGTRGARPRGGRSAGKLVGPAQARIAHLGAASCQLTRLAIAAGEQARHMQCTASGWREGSGVAGPGTWMRPEARLRCPQRRLCVRRHGPRML